MGPAENCRNIVFPNIAIRDVSLLAGVSLGAGVSQQKAKHKKPNHECVVFDDESGLPKNQAICFFATASEMRCCTLATYGGVFGTGLSHI